MQVHIFPQTSCGMQQNPCSPRVQQLPFRKSADIFLRNHKPALYIQMYYPLDKNTELPSFQDIRLIYAILHSDLVIQNPVPLFLLLT